jgi:Trypsin-like peptidase domain/Tetratricopeptide repeat
LKLPYLIFCVILTNCISCYAAGNAGNQAIVCLQTDFSNGKPKLGTGFFISPTLIVTASHQVTEPGVVAVKVTAYLHNNTAIKVKLPIVAQGEGVAILGVSDGIQSKYLLLQDNIPDVEAIVSTVGCQKDSSRLTREGNVMKQMSGNNAHQTEFTNLIPLNLPIQVGFSGGPLLTDNGDVFGIVYGFDEHSESLSYAIPANKLFQLMASQKALDYGKTLFYQGILAFSLKEHALAKKYFEQAIHQQPDYFEAYTSLGMALFKLRQFGEARDALLEAILIKTNYPLAYYHLGGVYREGLFDRRSARNAYRRYLELDPTSSDAVQVKEWLQEIEDSLTD